MKQGEFSKKLTQEEVDRVLDSHQQGLRANFKNCDLSGLDLSGRNLEGVVFENTNLNGANLSGTNLRQGEIKNCLLIGANLEKANLYNIDFVGCAMQNANLSHVTIEGVGFKESNMAQASLKGTAIEFSNLNVFREVNLNSADLSGAKISWVYGENVNLENATLRDSSISESQIKDSNFINASMENASIYSVEFKDCEMQQSVLAMATINNVVFEQSNLENAYFIKSEIGYGNFVGSKLDGANFSEATLSSLNQFSDVSLIATNFSGAKISADTKMKNVPLTNIIGLDNVQWKNYVKDKHNAVAGYYSVVSQDREVSSLTQYQNQLSLFYKNYPNDQVTIEVDCGIVKTMMEQGYGNKNIASAVAMYSPNAPNSSKAARDYATGIVIKINDKLKLNERKEEK